jgi:hypothetical protein
MHDPNLDGSIKPAGGVPCQGHAALSARGARLTRLITSTTMFAGRRLPARTAVAGFVLSRQPRLPIGYAPDHDENVH